jgi:hydrogenase/urease accessory protein HupE
VFAILFHSGQARAHTIGLSTGEYAARGSSLVVTLAFARSEIATLAPALDANRDGHISAAEVAAARSLLEAKILAPIAVSVGGEPCSAQLTDAGLMEQDGLLVTGRIDCPLSNASFEVDVGLLDALPNGHGHIARAVSGASTHDEVLDRTHRHLTIVPVAATQTTSVTTPAAKVEERPSTFGAFFRMGLFHILTGYDHLLFLLALVLVRTRVRALIAVVTAFSLAHSLTLALSALHVFVPSARMVEPAIALSIVYVAVENFFVASGEGRWRITFPFGLVHGFGFAGALAEVSLQASAVPKALVAFNLGVEGGQLAVLAMLLPLLAAIRSRPWFDRWGFRRASGAIALVGAVWFAVRIVSG